MTIHGQTKTPSFAVAAVRSGKDYPISPKTAWKLWEQFHVLADLLWEAYECEFLDFCIEECENRTSAPEPKLQE
jgi:hypothetical protein